MTYSIRFVQFAEATGHVLNVGWSFTTADGVLSSTHVLQVPAGDMKAEEITDTVLIDWLRQQSSQTEEEMTASIKAERARRDEALSQVTVDLHAGESIKQAVTRQRREEEERKRQAEEERREEQARLDAIPDWDPDTDYASGEQVKHQGLIWEKLNDDGDSEPDPTSTDWRLA